MLMPPDKPITIELDGFQATQFYTILIDAIGLAAESIDHTHDTAKAMLARASVMNCALLIECCANVCASRGNITGAKKKSVIGKLDAFALSLNGSSIDQGMDEVKAIVELRHARNEYVHAKVEPRELRPPDGEIELPEDHGARVTDVHPGASEILKLSNDPGLWTPDDALRALVVVREFLRYYFVDTLALKPKEVFKLLSTKLTGKGMTGHFAETILPHVFDVAHQKLNIDFRFLGTQELLKPESKRHLRLAK
jgi:hypothetical protein